MEASFALIRRTDRRCECLYLKSLVTAFINRYIPFWYPCKRRSYGTVVQIRVSLTWQITDGNVSISEVSGDCITIRGGVSTCPPCYWCWARLMVVRVAECNWTTRYYNGPTHAGEQGTPPGAMTATPRGTQIVSSSAYRSIALHLCHPA